MPHSVASDLGLHCLPLSHKEVARLIIWVDILPFPKIVVLKEYFGKQCRP